MRQMNIALKTMQKDTFVEFFFQLYCLTNSIEIKSSEKKIPADYCFRLSESQA